MQLRTTFIDLVHVIGALGCLVMTGGLAADGQFARSLFYGLCTMGFVLGLVHRQQQRQVPAASVPPTVIDLRDPADETVAPRP